jgi:predicted ATPase
VLDELFGREREQAVLAHFVDELVVRPRTLVLVGEAGVGKTSLLEGSIAQAEERGTAVLTARPADNEAQLSFAGLADTIASGITAATLGSAASRFCSRWRPSLRSR